MGPSEHIERREHELSFFEKRVDAMVNLGWQADRRYFRTDDLYACIQALPRDQFYRMSYYERWLHVLKDLMVERGVLNGEEINQRIEKIRKEESNTGER